MTDEPPAVPPAVLEAAGRAQFLRQHPADDWGGLKPGQKSAWIRDGAPAAVAAWEAALGNLPPDGPLHCVLCCYVPCCPEGRTPVDDGCTGAVLTIAGGNASCECHLGLLLPDTVSVLLPRLREEARRKEVARG